jgi:hypothetical protein
VCLPDLEVFVRREDFGQAGFTDVAVPDRDEPVGVLVGKRPQQDGFEDAEDGTRRANPQPERQDDGEHQRRRAAEHSRSEPQILFQAFQSSRSGHVATSGRSVSSNDRMYHGGPWA